MLLKVLFYSIFSAAALFLLVKFMGEKQISQMNMFDYITGITIGSIAAEMATNIDFNPLRGYNILCNAKKFKAAKDFSRQTHCFNAKRTIAEGVL